jgi:hypothetical protein
MKLEREKGNRSSLTGTQTKVSPKVVDCTARRASVRLAGSVDHEV